MMGKQAADALKEVKIEGLQTFAQIYDLQDLTKAATELDTKIHFATVQSMVQRVVYSDNPPSIGDYDCIVVDEAHRGYTLDQEMEVEELILRDQKDFQSKYRMVLDYFDAYRIGLTATPAIHTAEIFGKPAFTYSYRKAVTEGYLIDFEPPFVFETRLGKDGIVWKEGDEVKIYDPEENEIVDAGVTDDEIKVEISGFNRRVINDSFNRNILAKLIADYGIHPEDKKKTLIFAATNLHADMIVNILREEFEAFGEAVDDNAIAKITGEVYDRTDLLRSYKNDLYPSIVVTVDLLTTGIDVPAISNIIFLRRVNSRILYDQMMGRATRRCDEIGKEVFKVYDCVGVTKIMAKENVMKPIAPLVKKTFIDLSEEITIIQDEYLKEVKLDRIIAKLQRKTRSFDPDQMERFTAFTGEPDAKLFGQKLKAIEPTNLTKAIAEYEHLWNYLDREKGRAINYATLYSEHEDEILAVSRAFDKNLKPKDYIESFTEFIQQNINEVAALKIVCTKPNSLTRKDLKELKFILDEQGFNRIQLNTAYKVLTNEKIVADIITHVRSAALNTDLIPHEERINRAITKLKNNHNWNQIQLKWLERIKDQLIQESVITIADLNKPPFSNDGGLKRLDKIFKNQTTDIIRELNEYLYQIA
jgi:type I restriction enzyme R subunit